MPESDPAASTALLLLIGGGCVLAVSGFPGLALPRLSAWGSRIATTLAVAGSLLGLAGGCLALGGSGTASLGLASPMPGFRAGLGVDGLSAFFSLPVFLIGGLGSLYGASYWSPRLRPRHGRRLRLCYGLLVASLAFILLARDSMVFLIAWECMALTNFIAVTTEEEDPGVRRAGWLYLLYSHVMILVLFALFIVEWRSSHDLTITAIPATAPPAMRTAIFVLALLGFGIKAGVMPLHSWLPAAHASAPSHVSALMSGVVIKMGIYGLVRTCGLLAAPPPEWGVTLLALGSLAAFLGVLFALGQHDLKRLLAYHSIENIGIILLGLGLAMVGRSVGRADWVVLGMAGCLLHVWNHALFKSLLFFGAGSVVHATKTRDLDLCGGLGRRMPVTAALFALGAVAICGLPPLNGFVSELFVYLGLARAAIAPGAAWAALPAPVLAATGALAVACFVKVFGVVFLGEARSPAARRAHEAPALMLVPMAVLAAACVAVGAAPGLIAPALERAMVAALPADGSSHAPLARLAPLGWITVAAAVLVAAAAAAALLVAPACRRGRRRQPSLATWGCGQAAGSPRLQYTASSFAQLITDPFSWVLRPRVHHPAVAGPFPLPSRFHSHADDPLLDELLRPASRCALRLTAKARALPGGQLQRYILYILAVLVPLLAWALWLPSS